MHNFDNTNTLKFHKRSVEHMNILDKNVAIPEHHLSTYQSKTGPRKSGHYTNASCRLGKEERKDRKEGSKEGRKKEISFISPHCFNVCAIINVNIPLQ